MGARTSVRPVRIAVHPSEPSLLLVTYDVVAVRDDGGETRLAADQEAPLHIDQGLHDDVVALFARLGQRMEVAAGLAEEDDRAPGAEGTPHDEEDEEL